MKQLFLFFQFLFPIFSFAQTSTLNRANDPVILTGNQLPGFGTVSSSAIVGFKFINGNWVQIPVQADERTLLDIVMPYGPLAAAVGVPPSPNNPKLLYYTDAATNIGADPNPNFYADDELVFMAKDAGGKVSGAGLPGGVIAGSGVEITITDPLGGIGYVYLFRNAGSLQQNAGVNYVTYTSNVTSTPGFPVNANTTNAENTTISTPKYSWHFSSEWVSDELKMATGNNTDILDRYKNFFTNGSCVRHEDIFSAQENAYIANKVGPVRIIRSYMGAASGPFTQRTHFFYEGRHDIATDLRVHSIGSIYDAFDYTPAANGMTYRNNLNPNGIAINGQPDALTPGDLVWEQVSGAPGTLSILHRRTTTLTGSDANFVSYYDDNSANPASICTGDGQAWGTSGIGIIFTNANACTDPLVGGCGVSSPDYRTMQSRRIMYHDAANVQPTTASAYNNRFNNPFQVTAANITALSVPKNTVANSIMIYPNPGKEQLVISTDQAYKLEIYDVTGKVITAKKLEKGFNKFDLTESGLFILRFTKDGELVKTIKHLHYK